MKRLIGLVIAFSLFATTGGNAQQVVSRGIVDGKKIEILADFTWRYESPSASGCKRLHSKLEFCGDPEFWRSSTPPSPEILAQYRHDDRNYAQVILEDLGSDDNVNAEFMRGAVIENAAAATGGTTDDVAILDVVEMTFNGQPAETVVYHVKINGLDVVFANTIVISKRTTLQAMTFSVASTYTDEQRRLLDRFLSKLKLSE
ncbi:MAG: hypothetical protein GY947_03880 [Rhodobacteraceae bacterium]|nr:hypothetical protein [Paracoccaceae bacterium]